MTQDPLTQEALDTAAAEARSTNPGEPLRLCFGAGLSTQALDLDLPDDVMLWAVSTCMAYEWEVAPAPA